MTLENESRREDEYWEWTAERDYWAYPKWITAEKQKRAKCPDPKYYATSIIINFMTPSGDEQYARYYIRKKRPLALVDYSFVIRHLEDRFLLELEKSASLATAVEDDVDEVDLAKIRLYFRTKSKERKQRELQTKDK